MTDATPLFQPRARHVERCKRLRLRVEPHCALERVRCMSSAASMRGRHSQGLVSMVETCGQICPGARTIRTALACLCAFCRCHLVRRGFAASLVSITHGDAGRLRGFGDGHFPPATYRNKDTMHPWPSSVGPSTASGRRFASRLRFDSELTDVTGTSCVYSPNRD